MTLEIVASQGMTIVNKKSREENDPLGFLFALIVQCLA